MIMAQLGLHLLKTLLGRLLRLVGNLGVVDGTIARVSMTDPEMRGYCGSLTPLGRLQRCRDSCPCCQRSWGLSNDVSGQSSEVKVRQRTVAAVELLVEHLLGMLLGLLGGVGVVEVSLVAAGDLSLRHDEG